MIAQADGPATQFATSSTFNPSSGPGMFNPLPGNFWNTV
jgi:hypothetical protein